MMIRGKFLSTRQRADLEDVLRHQREEHGVARRANAILLLDDGESCQTIAKFLYLDDDTIRTWHKQYMSGGFDGLFTFDWRGGTSRMSAAEEADLCAHFSRTMPRNPRGRLWGVMHKYVTHNRFCRTYDQFTEAILNFFSRTVPKQWPEFRDTVTDNFRIISHQNFRVLE